MLLKILCNIFLVYDLSMMSNFFKESVRELKHVVWPTRDETRNYFLIVVVVLVLFGLYLFIASTVFTKWIFGLQKLAGGWVSTSIETPSNMPINFETLSGAVQNNTVTVDNVVATWTVNTSENNSVESASVQNSAETPSTWTGVVE